MTASDLTRSHVLARLTSITITPSIDYEFNDLCGAASPETTVARHYDPFIEAFQSRAVELLPSGRRQGRSVRERSGQGVSVVVSTETSQPAVRTPQRPTFCSDGNPADGTNRPVLLLFLTDSRGCSLSASVSADRR